MHPESLFLLSTEIRTDRIRNTGDCVRGTEVSPVHFREISGSSV